MMRHSKDARARFIALSIVQSLGFGVNSIVLPVHATSFRRLGISYKPDDPDFFDAFQRDRLLSHDLGHV